MPLFAVETEKDNVFAPTCCVMMIVQMSLHESTPGQQNPLIFLQLLHEGRVRFGDSPFLFNIVEGCVQVPAILLHSIGDHCGGGATDAHLTVNQTLSAGLPGRDGRQGSLVALQD